MRCFSQLVRATKAGDLLLNTQLMDRTRALRGEQFGHDHLDLSLMREADMRRGHASEMMDNVAGLRFVPPSHRFNHRA